MVRKKGNAYTRVFKAIEFHPNIEVIPETRISGLSCIQAQPLSPQADFFRAIKFNNHGNILHPPSSSAATSGSLWPLNHVQKSPLSCLCLHPLKGPDQGNWRTFMSSFLEGRFPEESAGRWFPSSSSSSVSVKFISRRGMCSFRWTAIVGGFSINNFLSGSQPAVQLQRQRAD